MGIHNNSLIGSSGQQGYQISRSVRLRSSASAYFNRTAGTPTNANIWTWSAWVKRGTLTTRNTLFSGGSTNVNYISFGDSTSTDNFGLTYANIPSQLVNVQSTAVFRDPSAWYHLMVVYDSTSATGTITGSATDRVRLYVNGVQITSFSATTPPTQNTSVNINAASAVLNLGRRNVASPDSYFDGYMTEVNFIDGQALTPSSFGETNSITGVWQPKKYAGTYGTNGFYLNFSDNSAATAAAIGKDNSGNGNNWTPNVISVTAGATYDSMLDTPTPYDDGVYGRGNYDVLNPVNATSAAGTSLSNGNLRIVGIGTGNNNGWIGTLGTSSGKWYYEVVMGENNGVVGISQTGNPNVYPGGDATSYGYSTAVKYNNNVQTAYGASLTGGDIVGVAYDLDAGTITFYKNNVSQGQAFSGLSGTYFPAVRAGTTGAAVSVNFGQQPFTYTPPTGFKALNTQNLPIPTIFNGANHFAATTYTGTGGAMSVSNAVNGKSFQPDWVWIKQRNGIANHVLADAIRGVDKYIFSNLTNAEATATAGTGITAFNSTGFSLGTETSTVGSVNAAGGTGTYVAWQWNAGGSTVTNTDGSISAQVRANPTAGFSIVTYTGNGITAATVGHGLGVAPKMIILKTRNGSSDWEVFHTGLSASNGIRLNSTAAQVAVGATSGGLINTSPTSTTFGFIAGTVNVNNVNASAETKVAYCFSAVAGYSAFGSYTGNNLADGPFVYLGFRPRWVMFKDSSTTGVWMIMDTARNTYNVLDDGLAPNNTSAESTYSNVAQVDFLSNGFKIRAADAQQYWNNKTLNSNIYIYAAFAENPFKNSLAI